MLCTWPYFSYFKIIRLDHIFIVHLNKSSLGVIFKLIIPYLRSPSLLLFCLLLFLFTLLLSFKPTKISMLKVLRYIYIRVPHRRFSLFDTELPTKPFVILNFPSPLYTTTSLITQKSSSTPTMNHEHGAFLPHFESRWSWDSFGYKKTRAVESYRTLMSATVQ